MSMMLLLFRVPCIASPLVPGSCTVVIVYSSVLTFCKAFPTERACTQELVLGRSCFLFSLGGMHIDIFVLRCNPSLSTCPCCRFMFLIYLGQLPINLWSGDAHFASKYTSLIGRKRRS
ncbi:unnamed protein product [Ectocarpus sp. 13 AM-2016]